MTGRRMGKRVRQLMLVFAAAALAIIATAIPAMSSSGGVGSQNVQAADCSAHNVNSPATISMSASKTNPAPGEQLTVSVAVSGGPTSGLMGVALLSKTSGSTGSMPTENGWTMVSDPAGTKFNYVELQYSGSKTFTWTLKAPTTTGSPKLFGKIFHGNSVYVKTYSAGLAFTVQSSVNPPTVQISSPSSGATVSGSITVTATASAAAGATISAVALAVDGASLGTDTSSPYSWTLDTKSYVNGQHTLNATATDDGARKGYAQISITISNLANPTVQINSPSAGSTVGGSITVTATAGASSGASISSVQLRVDGTALSSLSSAPYSWPLNTATYAKGAHTLNVTATDSGARKGYAQISVNFDNDPPTVIFSAPANGATISGMVSVTASATAYGGRAISSVGLWVDGTLMGMKTAPPYSWSLDTNALSNGQHSLNLTATDSNGNKGYRQITVTVGNSGPAVDITLPANGAQVKGLFSVTAIVNSSSLLSYVTMSIDGAQKGNLTAAPFAWTVDSTGYMDGTHYVLVKAIDSYGRSGSQQIMAQFNNTGHLVLVPVVTINSPLNGAILTGEVVVRASVSSGTTLARVGLYLDGALVLEKISSPCNWTLATASYSDGQHTLNVSASDAEGNSGFQMITVTFSNPPPEVTIAQPSTSTVFGTVRVNASSVGANPIKEIRFLLDGRILGNSSSSSGSWAFDSRSYSNGQHDIKVIAFDDAGKNGSAGVKINVDNSAPTVRITSPFPGAGLFGKVLVTAEATSNLTIIRASLSIGNVSFGNISVAPFQWTVDVGPLPYGDQPLVVMALASNGQVGRSQANVTIQNRAPSIAITSPNGTSSIMGDIQVIAEVQSAVPLTYVSFRFDGAEVQNLTAAPYGWDLATYRYSNGPHQMTVRAVAANGKSSSLNLSMELANPPPVVRVQGLTEYAEISGTLEITAIVTAPYPIKFVSITLGGTELVNLSASPYVYSLDTLSFANGQHSLNVTAMGEGGIANLSSIVMIISNAASPVKLELGSLDLLMIQGFVIIVVLGIALKSGGRRKRSR